MDEYGQFVPNAMIEPYLRRKVRAEYTLEVLREAAGESCTFPFYILHLC
jgi:hypothetical protein